MINSIFNEQMQCDAVCARASSTSRCQWQRAHLYNYFNFNYFNENVFEIAKWWDIFIFVILLENEHEIMMFYIFDLWTQSSHCVIHTNRIYLTIKKNVDMNQRFHTKSTFNFYLLFSVIFHFPKYFCSKVQFYRSLCWKQKKIYI